MEAVVRLVGVYNADGGVRGEIAYILGKIRGTAQCALCDITHRGVRKNREFADLSCQITVPFDFVHLNERSSQVAAVSEDRTPCVLAETNHGFRMLLQPDDLATIGGDANAFLQALHSATAAQSLRFPGTHQSGGWTG